MLNPAPFCQVFLIHYMEFQVLPLQSIPSNVTAAMYFLRPMTELKQKKSHYLVQIPANLH